MNRPQRTRLVCSILLLICSVASANVELPKVIGDNMVLQRDMPLPIWGTATPGESVTVKFADQEKSTTTDANGKWRVTLDAQHTSAVPRDMTITAANTLTVKNLLVGEVWLCSGQSNMEYPMGRGANYHPPRTGPDPMPQDLATSADPQIRLFRVQKVYSQPDVTSFGWKECNPANLAAFSAVGYYFGRELHNELQVPIGLIQSAWGGSRIEPWTPAEAYLSVPEFKLPAGAQNIQIDGVKPGKTYRSMIQPMIPFAMRGTIWYQGESNVIEGNDTGPHYANKMRALIESWRAAWGEGNFPFYYVQIAPYAYSKRKTDKMPHTVLNEPDVWEGQTQALQIPKTGMAATVDIVDNTGDIHPPNKWDVGKRLSLWALSKDYGHTDRVVCGPMFKKLEIQGNKARITFDHVGGGLISKDARPLTSFTIAGADGQFQPADATIDGESLLVSSPNLPAPVAVRFAWEEIPTPPNLFNKEGLPAFPFRTDGPPVN